MSAIKSTLTAERLRELLHYDSETGVFTNRVSRSPKAQAGMVAGSQDQNGYLLIRIDWKLHRAHRLAWLYVYGEWPKGLLDHRNRIKSDNRITNLRPADKVLNGQNRAAAQSNNETGFLGVCRHFDGHFRAVIQHDGRQRHIGLYDTPEEAHAAYLEAKRRLHSEALHT